jgi:hypothetical protein
MRILTRRAFVVATAIAAAVPVVSVTAARAAEEVDLLLVTVLRRLAQHRRPEIQAAARRLRCGHRQSARHPGDPLRRARQRSRSVLGRMVRRRRAEGRHRLDRHSRRSLGQGFLRPGRRGAARLRGSHLDQRRHRFRHGAAQPRSPYQANRRTIDVSGDGTNNAGRDVADARDEALAKGVTINGLVILSERPMSWNADHTNPPGGLDNYYRNNVSGGPGSFVMVAENFELVRPGDPQQAHRRNRRQCLPRACANCASRHDEILRADRVYGTMRSDMISNS